jgi:hypothetical protein
MHSRFFSNWKDARNCRNGIATTSMHFDLQENTIRRKKIYRNYLDGKGVIKCMNDNVVWEELHVGENGW